MPDEVQLYPPDEQASQRLAGTTPVQVKLKESVQVKLKGSTQVMALGAFPATAMEWVEATVKESEKATAMELAKVSGRAFVQGYDDQRGIMYRSVQG